MVISSIDLKDGYVVQLKNGRDLMLQRDDADALIAEFSIYGETAVIDLDAALGNVRSDGTTANTAILNNLLRRGNVRVGGGIRDVQRAKELISLGAEKVIIGSAAFNTGEDALEYGPVNAVFLDRLVEAIGKERIIVSVDALYGNIVLRGWTQTAGIGLVEGARAVEKYASELLFTCVEREGCMGGIDMDLVKQLRSAVGLRLVVAGGVSSVDEIASLEKMGCDVQLGMALYTGAVSLSDAFIDCLNWEKAPLIPVIAQGVCGEVLMLGFANREAFAKTFATKTLTFWSRTRETLWTKGEQSGNVLRIVSLRADCDRDTVLATVIPQGPVCHTGAWTCFNTSADRPYSLQFLYEIIAERFSNPRPASYTASLDAVRVREKIMEEAQELTAEAEGRGDIIWEFADLFYFLSVLMYKEGIAWKDILDELDRRHKK